MGPFFKAIHVRARVSALASRRILVASTDDIVHGTGSRFDSSKRRGRPLLARATKKSRDKHPGVEMRRYYIGWKHFFMRDFTALRRHYEQPWKLDRWFRDFNNRLVEIFFFFYSKHTCDSKIVALLWKYSNEWSGDRSSLDRSEIENQFESQIVSITRSSTLARRSYQLKNSWKRATRGQPIFFVEQTKETSAYTTRRLPRIDDKERSENKFPLIP